MLPVRAGQDRLDNRELVFVPNRVQMLSFEFRVAVTASASTDVG